MRKRFTGKLYRGLMPSGSMLWSRRARPVPPIFASPVKISMLPSKKKYTTVIPENAEPTVLAKARPQPGTDSNTRIFLIDTMSFIFRAYHAMARQRSMSTKTGLPTAATYVFVNMLRKLRDDFSPEYIAAVFDVAAPTFRKQQAEAITSVRRFDLKTQTFQEAEYH